MGVIKFLDPKNDYAFKRIFGTEKNKDILVDFLNDILTLPDKIQTVAFLTPSQDPEARAKKQSIVDVLCADEKGVHYVVEMQVARSVHFVKRAQFYAAKAYTGQLSSGEEYGNLKQVIFLAITDFVMFKDKSEFKSDHVILDKDSLAHDLKDFSFTFLELPKFTKKIGELRNNVDRWMYFFKHAQHTKPAELEQLISQSATIDRAYQVLDQFYWSDDEIAIYERELKSERDGRAILASATNEGLEKGLEQGLEKGLAQGLERGRTEEKKEAARKMLSLGMGLQTVQSVTDLPMEEVERLAAEQEVPMR